MRTTLLAGAAGIALATGPAAAQDLVFAPGEDDRFSWESFEGFAEAHDLTGQTLTILGPWTGQDAALVQNVVAYFAAATGATVQYSGSGNFEQDVVVGVNAGSPPNIAVIAQPGLAADLAARGFVEPLGGRPPTGCARTMPLVKTGSTSRASQAPTARRTSSASSTRST